MLSFACLILTKSSHAMPGHFLAQPCILQRMVGNQIKVCNFSHSLAAYFLHRFLRHRLLALNQPHDDWNSKQDVVAFVLISWVAQALCQQVGPWFPAMPLVCVLRISVFSHLDSYELKQAHSVAIFGHELISIYRQPNWLGEAEDSTRTEAISSNLKQSQAISSNLKQSQAISSIHVKRFRSFLGSLQLQYARICFTMS